MPFGAPSLETLVPLMWSEGVVNRGLPVTWMARVMAENPARIFRLPGKEQESLGIVQAGRAMLDVLPQLENGCINYWEAGNWALNGKLEIAADDEIDHHCLRPFSAP